MCTININNVLATKKNLPDDRSRTSTIYFPKYVIRQNY